MPGRGHRMFLLCGMQYCCLCLRQGTDAAFKERDARLRAEPDAQARGAADARTEADWAVRKTDALPVSGAAQPGAQRGAWTAPAAPARSTGAPWAAPLWMPVERGRSVSSADAAPATGAGRTGAPACGQRDARVWETGPAYTSSGGGGTASPAPPPIYGRAGAMWARVEAWGRADSARTGGKAERLMAGAAPAASTAV